MKKKNILFIIPARGGSKEISNKNIINVNGKPLISYSITEALKAKKYFYKEAVSSGNDIASITLVVSTDSLKIAKIAKKFGAEVPFLRPKNLATDQAPTLPVLKHALKYIENNDKIKIDWVMLLQATNPFTKANDIIKCIKMIKIRRVDSVVSVRKANECHQMYLNKIKNKFLLPIKKGLRYLRRQDIKPDIYKFSGNIFITKKKFILNNKKNYFFGGRVLPYIVDKKKSLEVDEKFDLDLIRLILKNDFQNSI